MSTIRQLHAEWAALVVPKDAPPIQRQEMERAFYSGAYALFNLFTSDVSALPDDAAEVEMTKLHHEARDYFVLLAKIPGTHGTTNQ